MYFDSLSDFIAMNGHGAYVWSCVFISSAAIAILFLIAKKQFNRQHKINKNLNNLP